VLVGRERELTVLGERVAAIESDGGCVVLVRGEAGIGKSSLIKEFAARHEDEIRLAIGWCDDLKTPQPLGPFRDIARGAPSVAEPLRSGDRLAVMDGAFELLSDPTTPTVMVLEDTQWADEVTLDAIKYLGRRSELTHGILVVSYRDGEVDRDHPLRSVIGALPPQTVIRIRLERLARSDVAIMVENSDLDVEAVMAWTNGNPLFVNELVASGVDHIPFSVQDAVVARAAKLSKGARELLDLVSVIPGQAGRATIQAIASPTENQLTECERQGLLIVHSEHIAFRHELARRAIESALDGPGRRDLNRQVLSAIASTQNWAQLVHHAAASGDLSAIVEFAPKAAEAAMAVGSNREAISHFELLDENPDLVTESDRAGLIEKWARAAFYLDGNDALALVNRAIALHRQSHDDRALAATLAFAVRVAEADAHPRLADDYSAEAIDILESHPKSSELAYALCQRAWLRMVRSDGDEESAKLSAEAALIAADIGDELLSIQALTIAGCFGPVGDRSSAPMLIEALRRATVGGFLYEETYALNVMAFSAMQDMDLEAAAQFGMRARTKAIDYEIGWIEFAGDIYLAEIQLWRGNWEAAEDAANDALASAFNAQCAQRVLGLIQARLGRSGAANTLDELWSGVLGYEQPQQHDPAASAIAEWMWITGNRDPDRIALLNRVMQGLLDGGCDWPSGEFSFWTWKLGLMDTIPEDCPDKFKWIADGHWQKAASLWEAQDAPYGQALALMCGDTEHQLEAIEILESLGATAVADRVRRQLLEQGVRVPRGRSRSTREHAAGLTARQAEVLEHLSHGLTNAAIADLLFVSQRTVEHHVAAILMKLDVSSRDEAVTSAQSLGLLPAK
jgi:DNA-binding CsgD family transcriptional regulator